MMKRPAYYLSTLCVLVSAALLGLSARATLQERRDDAQAQSAARYGGGDDDDRDEHGRKTTGAVRLATGQFVTPMAVDGAVQQYLNPGRRPRVLA
jgi:hypothetical protein